MAQHCRTIARSLWLLITPLSVLLLAARTQLYAADVPATPDATVAADGSAQFKTVQAAVDAAPADRRASFTIHIAPDHYKEVITVPAEKPFLRKVLLRLPRSLLPLGQSYGHVFAIDEDGRVTESLQDPSGAYPEATGATETADRLYIHSLNAHGIGWLPR